MTDQISHYAAILERRRKAAVTRAAVAGMTGGTLLALVGAYWYWFVPYVNDDLWLAVSIVGLGLAALSLIAPVTLQWLERLLHGVGNAIGALVFGLLLGVFYAFFALFRPYLRRRHREFQSWQEAETAPDWSGWTDKISTEDFSRDSGRRPLMFLPAQVLVHFARQKHYILMPLLLIMMLVGLLFFFLQTSALAPFIYTLF